jgi:(R,R)-butanediol dehydrogenase/meso-butanediol dehydrogenase/diacetyl reductase
LNAVRSHGTITQVGLHVKPASFDPMNLSNRDLSLIGTWCYPVTDWPRIIALVASGRFPVEKAVSDVVPVADIVGRGFDRLLDPNGDAQKILVAV